MRIAILAVATLGTLSACNTVPDPVPEPVVINVEPIDTCMPVSALTRVVIPEVTQTYTAITEIDNPPYEPIQQTQQMTRIIEPERITFVDSQGVEVTDICETEINPNGMVSDG
ncbi:MAG: hypothetical protein WBF53_04705 [Litorimonas sp.]